MYLRQKFGHGAWRIQKDHPEKDWNRESLNKLLARINETGSIERAKGSGRRTEETLDIIEELILSQEDAPGTHKTPSEIADFLECSERTVNYAVRDDLDLKPLRKVECQNLTSIDCAKCVDQCNEMLHKYTDAVLEYAFFSDEKVFKFQQHYNHQNDRFYVKNGAYKSDAAAEHVEQQRRTFPKCIMVSVGVCKQGKTKEIRSLNQ